MILYSKKEGIGYLSPLGEVDEGSEVFLSTIGCLAINGIDGLPALIILGAAAVVVEKFIFCIGSNSLEVLQFYQLRAYDTLHLFLIKNSTSFFAVIGHRKR